MNKPNNKKTSPTEPIKSFPDMIAPSVIKFYPDHYIFGNTYRSVFALREYPTVTSEQAILSRLGEKDGVVVHIYTRQVTPTEEKAIIHNAENKNKMNASADRMRETIEAQNNLQDVAELLSSMQRNREPLLHCAVYIEMIASDMDKLKQLQTEVLTELVRSKMNVERLILRQQEGFLSVSPTGKNTLGSQFERVLPAGSVANLFPLNYSGKTNTNGFYLGKDKFGSNIIVDFNQRDEDKTNANILILGNSGQGKSYLLKLILCNIRESGKSVIILDPEHEFCELCENLGGCFVDLMSGQYMINPLEPKSWDDHRDAGSNAHTEISFDYNTGACVESGICPQAFLNGSKLSQHISFLKDFFRNYKDFDDRHIDTVEIMLSKLYSKWNISDSTDFGKLSPADYPILSDLYSLIEMEYKYYDNMQNPLYPKEILQDILLGLHSMCEGAESKFFNGHTNITTDKFIVFGVKGLLQASKNVKNALLFNVLSYMSDRLLTTGNTVAALDELYIFLTNTTVIEYIRNFMKRVRKKESAVILSSQNIEDFALPGIAELTKPLFSIPVHQFIFNAGSVDARFLMDALALEPSEFNLIKYPQQGVCLYKCGNERYNLAVHAPEYKEKLFGTAGGR